MKVISNVPYFSGKDVKVILGSDSHPSDSEIIKGITAPVVEEGIYLPQETSSSSDYEMRAAAEKHSLALVRNDSLFPDARDVLLLL